MKYAIDLDGTLCTQEHEYHKALPYPARIKIVNELYNAGHRIKIFTARGTTTKLDWTQLTKNQLEKWGVRYHELIFGKPDFDLLIDDKAISSETFFNNQWR